MQEIPNLLICYLYAMKIEEYAFNYWCESSKEYGFINTRPITLCILPIEKKKKYNTKKNNTPCPSITKPKQELFCQKLFFYKDKNVEIKRNQISLLIRVACSQENKKHVVKIIGP